MNTVITGIAIAIGGQTAHWQYMINQLFLKEMKLHAKYIDQDLRELLRLIRNFNTHLEVLSSYKVLLEGDIFEYFNY